MKRKLIAMILAAGAMLGAWATDTHNKVQLWDGGPYWATTNIGAEKPEDYGLYFWWGDTIGYKWENNAWVASDGSSSDFSFESGNAPTYGKDTATLLSEGWITADGVLAPEHDAAHVQWGENWRMPTVQDLNDLCYNKCVWIWTTTNGVNGYLVRGKDEYSSASIFLPCTGYGSGNSRTAFSSHGYYWSSVPASWNNAGGIVYLSDRSDIEYSSVRYAGTPIRPVSNEPLVTVSVTFDENFDGGSTTNMNISASSKVQASAPTVSERAGWTFIGWFDAAEGGNKISATDTPTDGATYYAHWLEGEFTAFGALGGSPWFVGDDGNWRSGDMADIDYGWSYLQTTVTGPGTLSFEWRTSSVSELNRLWLYVLYDGEVDYQSPVGDINGETEWTKVELDFEAGEHEVNLAFVKSDDSVAGDVYGTMRNWKWTPFGEQHDKVQLWEDGPYWATINIGADEPWDSGYYFWWGDTIGYKRVKDAWVAADGSSSDFSFEYGNTPTDKKDVATLQSEGWTTSGTDSVLAPEHDAAQVQWGGGWRMPTYQELYDLNSKCDWTWTTQNGVNGYIVRGRGDYASNSIFLPCCGYGNGTSLGSSGSLGYYWSSVPRSDNYHARYLYFDSGYHGTDDYGYRNLGFSVRPVSNEPLVTVSVTFDENFEGGSTTNISFLSTSKVLASAPEVSARSGWTFIGWYTEAEGGEQISATDKATDGATYYAHWIEGEFTFGGNAEGASWTVDGDGVWYSGRIPDSNGDVWFQTRVTGPGTLSFEWKLPDGDNNSIWLECRVNKDEYYNELYGGVTEWQRVTIELDEGEHYILFMYGEDGDPSQPGGGWVRNLRFGDNPVAPDVTIKAGEYFKATLAELGYDVPTDGQTAYSVKAYGLPAGLKLKSNAAVTKKVKKGKKTTTVVVTPAKTEWWIEGVPTAALDYATNPPYLVITVNGVAQTLPLSLGVEAQDVMELDDLALGDSLNEQFYLPGVTNGWTVSGLPTGLKYTAKLVTTTKKKGKKVVSVTTNALPYSVYGKPTKAGLFTITAKKKTETYYETLKFRVLVNPAPVDTAIFGNELTNIVTMAYVPVAWDLTGGSAGGLALPVVSNVVKVAGLPKGVTFAAKDTYAYTNAKKKTGKYLKQLGQTIVGTPTKPGTYVVTFPKNVTTGTGKNKKTVAKTAQILWKVVANDAELSLGFNTAGGEIKDGSVGLNYGDLLAFSATDGAKVTASGLPKGITLANLGDGQYAFKGFTAKAGTYLVTVKATLNGKTVTQRVALKVDGLPSWAKGTYNGVVYATSGDLDYAGYGTVSVSSAGKISGKFSENGTNWTFSASSYDFYTDKGGHDGDTEIFQCTNIVAKYAYKVTETVKGKKKTVTKSLTRNYTLSAGNLEISPGVMRGTVVVTSSGDDGLVAYKNVWGQSDYAALGKKLFKTKSGSKTLAYKTWSDVDAEELTDAMSLSVKVTSAGAVTATMTFDTGKTTKDKKTNKKTKVYYKATATTVLIPLSAADADPFSAAALLCFAPSAANNFPGLCTGIEYPFAKREAQQPGQSNNWYTGEFTGFGDAQSPIPNSDEYDILNGLVTINVAANLSFTGTFAATDGTTASFSGTFAKDGDMYAASGVAITVRGQAMTMRLGCAAQPYADKDAGFGEMWGGSDAEPGESCIALNCLWQNIWKRSDLTAEWKPAFASGTQKTLDLSDVYLDGKVEGDGLTYAFGSDGKVAVSGQIYGESVSSTATLDLEGYDDSTNTMYCNFYFLANGHMYQQQCSFPRQSTIEASDITYITFQRVD